MKKHPEPADVVEDALVDEVPEEIHPVVFDVIDSETIRKAILKTKGGAGPSGLDADGWRHILLSKNFKDANAELRNQLALCCRRIATEKIDVHSESSSPTSSLEAYLACRLVPLDKSPGLRPIGVSDVIRRVLGKAFMSVVRDDVREIAGAIQVCAGQPGGCEAAIHATKDKFNEEDTDAVLLLDASNAFNSMNRATMLENIRRTCPIVYIYAYNCYSVHVRLFIIGGEEIKSKEGTTQGDPPAVTLYGLGLITYY